MGDFGINCHFRPSPATCSGQSALDLPLPQCSTRHASTSTCITSCPPRAPILPTRHPAVGKRQIQIKATAAAIIRMGGATSNSLSDKTHPRQTHEQSRRGTFLLGEPRCLVRNTILLLLLLFLGISSLLSEERRGRQPHQHLGKRSATRHLLTTPISVSFALLHAAAQAPSQADYAVASCTANSRSNAAALCQQHAPAGRFRLVTTVDGPDNNGKEHCPCLMLDIFRVRVLFRRYLLAWRQHGHCGPHVQVERWPAGGE